VIDHRGAEEAVFCQRGFFSREKTLRLQYCFFGGAAQFPGPIIQVYQSQQDPDRPYSVVDLNYQDAHQPF